MNNIHYDYGVQTNIKNKKRHTVIKHANGTKEWCKDGLLHREDGPAVEWANGDKHWYIDGKFHRENGPAIEWANGSEEWWKNDKLHREDGPAVKRVGGSKHWYIKGINLEHDISYLNKFLANPDIDPEPFRELIEKLQQRSNYERR